MRAGNKVETGTPYTPEWDHGVLTGEKGAGQMKVRWVLGRRVSWLFPDQLTLFDGRLKREGDSPSEMRQRYRENYSANRS